MPVIDPPVRARSEHDIELLQKLDEYLKAYREASRAAESSGAPAPPVVIGESGNKQIEIPDSLFEVIREAVEVLLDGGAVTIMPYHAQLTTQQAAEYLGVSRPHLISLLDKESIPYSRLKSHRRILLKDLEAYRLKRDEERLQALDELTREMYAAGHYEIVTDPEADE